MTVDNAFHRGRGCCPGAALLLNASMQPLGNSSQTVLRIRQRNVIVTHTRIPGYCDLDERFPEIRVWQWPFRGFATPNIFQVSQLSYQPATDNSSMVSSALRRRELTLKIPFGQMAGIIDPASDRKPDGSPR